jgi:hypothetical protein
MVSVTDAPPKDRSAALRGRRRDDRGTVAVLVTILMTTLLGVAALVVDVGVARDRSRQAQAAVDSAALAAAIVMLRNDGQPAARDAAKAYLRANFRTPEDRKDEIAADWDACTGCIVFTTTTVTVSSGPLPQDDIKSPAIFGSVYGASGFVTPATATATWSSPLAGDCLLCVVENARFDGGSRGVSLVDGGNAKIGEKLDIRSPGSLTVRSGDNFRGEAGHGRPTVDPGRQVLPLASFTDPYEGSAAADPWSVIGDPSSIPMARYDAAAGRCRPPYGKSIASITAADATTCPGFGHGMYVIHPGSNVIMPARAASSFTVTPRAGGDGVLFFLTCGLGSPYPCSGWNPDGAYLDRIGKSLTLKGLTAASGVLAPFRGFSIIADRHNTGTWYSGSDRHILGNTRNGDLVIHGNVYLPGQDLVANGHTTVHGQVVVGGDLTVDVEQACTLTCLTIKTPTLVRPPPKKVRLLVTHPTES